MAKVMGAIVSPEIGETVEQFTIFGYAKSYEVKATTYGDSTRFDGDFKAVNKLTGETFRSSAAFLPGIAADMLQSALDNSDGAVEFGFDVAIIGVKGKVEGEVGKYEYRVKPLTDASENDPLEALQARLASGVGLAKLPPAKASPATIAHKPTTPTKGKKK